MIENASRFYRTPCFPAGAGPDYVNACAAIRAPANAAPEDILAHLHAVEAACGRERHGRWGARTADLDLLAIGDTVLPDAGTFAHWRDLPTDAQLQRAPDRLILPHPRLQDRAFVLVPLAEIAPNWRHPVSGLSAARMRAALPPDAVAQVRPISAPG